MSATKVPLPALLGELRRLDARLTVDGDRLIVRAPHGALPDGLRAELAARKAEILAFLQEGSAVLEESVVARFESQVDATPDAAAVVTAVPARSTDPGPLSYRELDRRANRLAHQLVLLGVSADSRVGILLTRSADLVIAALATLKSGAAYVPVDPALPRERQTTMLLDTGVTVLITRTEPGVALPEARARVLCLKAWESELARRPDRRCGVAIPPDAPACVVYTSDPAAQPASVAVPHRAIVRDPFTFEIWGRLLKGGGLVLFPDLVEVRPSGRVRRWNPDQPAPAGGAPQLAAPAPDNGREEFAL